MASLTIRKLDEAVKTYLRLRSAGNGRSVEEEVRVILGDLIQGRPDLPAPSPSLPAPASAPAPKRAAAAAISIASDMRPMPASPASAISPELGPISMMPSR